MAPKPSGAHALRHGPIDREAFSSLRLSVDPDHAYAEVCRILSEERDPSAALAACSDVIGGHGVESVSLAEGSELLYVNRGDTYDATLCYRDSSAIGEGYFVSSWGDEYEEADRTREEDSGERRCAYCSEWAEQGEQCGHCGRDPSTGDPWPLRHVRLETGHVLRTWEAGFSGSRTRIGYAFSAPDGSQLFRGEDFRCSPLHAVDSDESLRALLGFLTLRPGDTDREYFADYSAAQLAFADSHDCALLAFLYSEDGEGTFADVDSAEEGEGRAEG